MGSGCALHHNVFVLSEKCTPYCCLDTCIIDTLCISPSSSRGHQDDVVIFPALIILNIVSVESIVTG